MCEQEFYPGQQVRVVARPYEDDKDLAGKSGTIVSYSHCDSGDNVYAVRFGGVNGWRMLYERDLVREDESVLLEEKKAKLQAEIEEIDKQLKEFHENENISGLRAGSVVHGSTTVIVKIRENWWHWFYVEDGVMSHHSNSEDKAVVSELKTMRKEGVQYTIFPASQD